jgi:capsular polysaccharide transport system permease protein
MTRQTLGARLKRMNSLFMWTVLIPTLLSLIYFGLIVSDVYISESRFVLRSPERQSPSALGMLFKGTGFSRAQDDAYTVQDFILSRDALKTLDERLAISKTFSSQEVDVFSRFSGLDGDASFEALHSFYMKKVDIQLDSQSSIATLRVRSFAPGDSFRINQLLLELSESLVNRLNERGRQDLIRSATEEVRLAEEKAKAASLSLSSFRSQNSVIDPERQSTLQLQQIAKLQDELVAAQAQLTQLQTFTKNNPQIPSLLQRVQLLRQQIAAETKRVAGGAGSLASTASGYQRLAIERDFSDKQLGSALVSLEQARNEAQRKQLYLERIVQANQPDKAMEPHRVKGVFATLALGLMAWGILSLLLAGIREHHS